MGKLTKVINKILGKELTSDQLILELRKKGCEIGTGVAFTNPKMTHIDTQFPFCIKIGDNVTVTADVTILAHDYSYSVLSQVYGVMPQNTKITTIGNNVFLGQSSIILMGTEIGDNVIIGAGAVVSGKIPSNTVWAGNPARQVCTLEEFKEKREKRFEEGAVTLAKQIVSQFHRKPTYKEMRMYIGLFTPRTEEYKHYFEQLNSRLPKVSECVRRQTQKYDGLDEFLEKNNIRV